MIRHRRRALGISQSDLANALGLTFQQVQKYERGSNRVSASKLYHIAMTLQTDIADFFQGLPPVNDGDAPRPDTNTPMVKSATFLMSDEGIQLVQSFPKIRSTRTRKKLLELICCTASEDDEAA